MLGEIYFKELRFGESIDVYSKLLEIEPENILTKRLEPLIIN